MSVKVNVRALWPQAKEHRQPLEAGRGKERVYPRASGRNQACQHFDVT